MIRSAVMGACIGDVVELGGLKDDGCGRGACLEEEVCAAVAGHHDEPGHVDPQARRVPAADGEYELLAWRGTSAKTGRAPRARSSSRRRSASRSSTTRPTDSASAVRTLRSVY